MTARLLSWAITVAVMLAGGLALWLARSALGPRIEALPDLAKLTEPEAPVVEKVEEPLASPEPVVEEPSGPQLTYVEIEAMLVPLPARVLELIGDARKELPEYRGMSSKDAAMASRSLRFFRIWGRTWNNRLDELEKETPPREECEIHAALAPTCDMLAEVYALLRRIPSISAVAEGQDQLDAAEQMVDLFLNPPEEEEVDGQEVDGQEEP